MIESTEDVTPIEGRLFFAYVEELAAGMRDRDAEEAGEALLKLFRLARQVRARLNATFARRD